MCSRKGKKIMTDKPVLFRVMCEDRPLHRVYTEWVLALEAVTVLNEINIKYEKPATYSVGVITEKACD